MFTHSGRLPFVQDIFDDVHQDFSHCGNRMAIHIIPIAFMATRTLHPRLRQDSATVRALNKRITITQADLYEPFLK